MIITRQFSEYVNDNYPNWDVSIALRYLPIINNLKKKLPKGSKILDVGSGEFGIATYLKDEFKVVGTDIDFGEKRSKNFTLIKASADKLPFKDNSFKAVVSVDMMEHLPTKVREKSIEEMVRVTDKYLFVAFPRSGFSELIDRFIARYYKFTHKEELGYLKEHIKYGLPKEGEIVKMLKHYSQKAGKEIKVKAVGNTNSFVWTLLLVMGFSQIKPITYIYHKLVLLLPVLQYINIWPTYRVIIYGEFV